MDYLHLGTMKGCFCSIWKDMLQGKSQKLKVKSNHTQILLGSSLKREDEANCITNNVR
jgi:hypothetical protein